MDQFQSYTRGRGGGGPGLELGAVPDVGVGDIRAEVPVAVQFEQDARGLGESAPGALPAHRISEPLAEIADEEMLVISGFLLARR